MTSDTYGIIQLPSAINSNVQTKSCQGSKPVSLDSAINITQGSRTEVISLCARNTKINQLIPNIQSIKPIQMKNFSKYVFLCLVSLLALTPSFANTIENNATVADELQMENQIICSGDFAIVDPGLFNSYAWSTGETTRVLVASAGTYSLTVTDFDGATFSSEVEILERTFSNFSIVQNCQSRAHDIYDLDICFDAKNVGNCGEFSIDIDGKTYGMFSYSEASNGEDTYCIKVNDDELFLSTNEEDGELVTIRDCNTSLSCYKSTIYDEYNCPNQDLALILSKPNADLLYPNEDFTFKLVVMNQGDLDAFDVVVTDFIGVDFDFIKESNTGASLGNSNDWELDGLNPTYTIAKLRAGETKYIDIRLKIKENPSSNSISNMAMIIAAKDEDGNAIEDEDSNIDATMPDTSSESDNESADDSHNIDDEVTIVDNASDFDHFDFERIALCIMTSTVDDASVCEGGSFSLVAEVGPMATPPLTYSWTGPNSFVGDESTITLDDVSLLEAGLYTVEIMDADNCSSISSAEVTVFENPVLSILSSSAICMEANPMELIASPAGGTFSGPGITGNYFDPDQLPAGDYDLTYTFTDANTCTSVLAFSMSVEGDIALSCNDDINISVDQSCSLGNVSVSLFLDGNDNPDFYTFRLKEQNGTVIDINTIGTYAGQCVIYEVIDLCSGNSCWGNLCIEDKLDPINANCECETPYIDDGVGNLIENPNCILYCHNIWDLEILEEEGGNNEVLPPVSNTVPSDNCLDFGSPRVYHEIIPADDCSNKYVIRTVAYDYYNYQGELESVECVQTFIVKPIDISSFGYTVNGLWDDHISANDALYTAPSFAYYLPEKEIHMPCGSDLSPEAIQAYYDIDTADFYEDMEEDDFAETPNIEENNEGIPYAYPYVVIQGYHGYHAKANRNNICNLYAVYSDQASDACGTGCNGGQIIARSWTMLDWCSGTTDVFVQQVTSHDKEPPVLGNPDITVSVEPWDCLATVEMPRPEHLSDGCDANPTWSIVPPLGASVLGNTIIGLTKGVHPVMYEAQDCCGNISTYQVLINVIDKAPPVAIALQDIVLNLTTILGSDGEAKIFAKDIDNFSHDGCGPVKLEIRRADGDSECHHGNGTFNDDFHEFDYVNDDDNGEFVKFCCADLSDEQDEHGNYYGEFDVVLRVWDDGDMNGIFGTFGDNYNESWTSIRVEDKLVPTVVCPANIEIGCEEDWLNYDVVGKPLAFTSCGTLDCGDPDDKFKKKPANKEPFLGEEIAAYNPTCRRGAIERTWNCSGKECNQWIIVRPNENLQLTIDWPNDTIINCLDGAVDEPVFTHDFCQLLGTSLEVDTFVFEEGACYKLLKYWSVINWCEYDVDDTDLNDMSDSSDDGVVPGLYQHTQIVKLLDENKPVVLAENVVVSTNQECVTEGATISAKATDEGSCASDWIKWDLDIDLWGDLTIDYTYSSGLPPSDPYYIGATSGNFIDSTFMGNEVTVVLPDGLPANCGNPHRIVWSAYDGCGNVTRVNKTLEIRDNKPPTPYMIDISSAVMESGGVELWASDFNIGSFDNCSDGSNLIYTFSPTVPPQLVNPTEQDPWYDSSGVASLSDYANGNAEKWNGSIGSSSRVFDCDNVEEANAVGGLYPVTVYAWDECGNSDFAIVQLNIADNNGVCQTGNRASISGKTITETGEGIDQVMIQLQSDQPNYPNEGMTAIDGSFLFSNNPMYNDYSMVAEKNGDWLNGVSTLDLVLIQKHILGQKPLNSAFKMIAADVSNDEKVSSIDLITLRKLILGIIADVPANDSWRFVGAGQELNPNNPWPFNESNSLKDLDQNMVSQDFIGVKIGDVNASAIANFNQTNLVERSSKSLNFGYNNLGFLKDEVITVDIKSSDFINIAGFQFELQFENLELQSIQSGAIAIAEANYSLMKDGVKMSWSQETLDVDADEVLFSFEFKTLGNGNLSESLILKKQGLNAEAYQGENFDVVHVNMNSVMVSEYYTLSQNSPNPWSSFTVLPFSIEKAGNMSMTIYDVSGKVLYSYHDYLAAGAHEISLYSEDLPITNGVMYYKIESGDFIQTKKMIMIE